MTCKSNYCEITYKGGLRRVPRERTPTVVKQTERYRLTRSDHL